MRERKNNVLLWRSSWRLFKRLRTCGYWFVIPHRLTHLMKHENVAKTLNLNINRDDNIIFTLYVINQAEPYFLKAYKLIKFQLPKSSKLTCVYSIEQKHIEMCFWNVKYKPHNSLKTKTIIMDSYMHGELKCALTGLRWLCMGTLIMTTSSIWNECNILFDTLPKTWMDVKDHFERYP